MSLRATRDAFGKTDHYHGSSRDDMLRYVPRDARRLLDVGCGSGRFLSAVTERHPSIEPWGIESDPDAADIARRRFANVQVGLFPSDFEAPRSHFDTVFFNDVLEHMVDPWRALDQLHEWLAPEATVVASIPSIRNYATLYELLVRGRWTYVSEGVLDVTHLRFFTKSSMAELFTSSGYRVERMEGSWPLTTWKMKALGTLTRAISPRAAAEMRFRRWIVVARPDA